MEAFTSPDTTFSPEYSEPNVHEMQRPRGVEVAHIAAKSIDNKPSVLRVQQLLIEKEEGAKAS